MIQNQSTAWRADGPMIFGTLFHPAYQKTIETVIASVLVQPTGNNDEKQPKNAQARREASKLAVLMAAAPKLLEACRAALTIRGNAEVAASSGAWPPGPDCRVKAMQAEDLVRDAIAEATSEPLPEAAH